MKNVKAVQDYDEGQSSVRIPDLDCQFGNKLRTRVIAYPVQLS